jgi:fatty-acyl-CoA synthase
MTDRSNDPSETRGLDPVLPRAIPTARHVAALFDEVAAASPSAPFLWYRGQEIKYGEFNSHVIAVAKGLKALGIKRGDRLAVLSTNRPEWILLCLAGMRLGAIVCPVNTWYKRDELRYMLEHSDPALLFSLPRFRSNDYRTELTSLIPGVDQRPLGELKISSIPSLRGVAFIEESPGDLFAQFEYLVALGRAIEDNELAAALGATALDDVAFILYTSGSTGHPKAVTLKHEHLIENGFNIGERLHLGASDRVWLGTPLFYSFGSANGLMAALTHRACVVLDDAFTPESALSTLSASRSTTYYGVGNMTRSIVEHPGFSRELIPELRKGNIGDSKNDVLLALEVLGVDLGCNQYGLTEGYGNTTLTDANDSLEVKVNTQGFLLPGWEMRLVDPVSRNPVRRGELGEVHIRGYVTPGYYKDDDRTSAAIDSEGWYLTGDLGRIRKDGRFVFHSRIGEMIKRSGVNVAPDEVTEVLVTHPRIEQAHAVGVPDSRLGERIVAFVDADDDLTEEEVRAFVRANAASYKTPDNVLFAKNDDLPRVASGKVPARLLRAEAMRRLGTREPQE